MGDTAVLASIVVVVGAWLAWQRHWRPLGHWLAAALVPLAIKTVLKLTTQVPRPLTPDWMQEVYAFPSGHATSSMAVYGFLTVMLVRELPYRWHGLAYTVTGLLVASIGFSRLYLGVHWLSDVAAGLSVALAWIALLGLAYRTHITDRVPSHRHLAPLTIAVIAIALAQNAAFRFPAHRLAYAAQPPKTQVAMGAWWEGAWKNLPAYRYDLRGQQDQPLSLQWAGALGTVRETLLSMGWTEPPGEAADLLQWFRGGAELDQIPVLPHVHDGRYETLALTRRGASVDELTVVRLWPSGVILTVGEEEQPLWTGTASCLRRSHPLGLSILRTAPGRAVPLSPLTDALDPQQWEMRYVDRGKGPGSTSVLIRAHLQAP